MSAPGLSIHLGNEPLNTPVLVEFRKSATLSHAERRPASIGTTFVAQNVHPEAHFSAEFRANVQLRP